MRKLGRSLVREDCGQSVVEFALLAPLFLLLLVGMFEFGRAWNIYQVVVNAAREGGRVAALPTGFANGDSVNARVESYLSSARLDAQSAQVKITDVDGAPGTLASVQVSYPYHFTFVGTLAHMLSSSSVAGGDLTLTSTVTMRNE
jgi:Flp pilus assembly protein TadG